MIYRCKRY